MSSAINMFLTQVVKRGGIPFEITNRSPGKELLQVFREVEEITNGTKSVQGYINIEELKKVLLQDDHN